MTSTPNGPRGSTFDNCDRWCCLMSSCAEVANANHLSSLWWSREKAGAGILRGLMVLGHFSGYLPTTPSLVDLCLFSSPNSVTIDQNHVLSIISLWPSHKYGDHIWRQRVKDNCNALNMNSNGHNLSHTCSQYLRYASDHPWTPITRLFRILPCQIDGIFSRMSYILAALSIRPMFSLCAIYKRGLTS